MCKEIKPLSDLEGNWKKFVEWVDGWQPDAPIYFNSKGRLQLAEGYCFVYGGDIGGRGPGSMRIQDEINHLKRQYPDRVKTILGNRDLNRIRFPRELSPEAMQKWPETGFMHHLPPAKRDYRKWLRAHLTELGQDVPRSDKALLALDQPAFRLQWMLDVTMNEVNNLEYRRRELFEQMLGEGVWQTETPSEQQRTARQLRDQITSTIQAAASQRGESITLQEAEETYMRRLITDEKLVESFVADASPPVIDEKTKKVIKPAGRNFEYMQQGELLDLFEDNPKHLFVHGALPDALLDLPEMKGVKTLDDLIGKLRELKQKDLDSLIRSGGKVGGNWLVQISIASEKGKPETSLVVARNSDATGNLAIRNPRMEKFLRDNGIEVVHGMHTPYGDHGGIVRSPSRFVKVLHDNSTNNEIRDYEKPLQTTIEDDTITRVSGVRSSTSEDARYLMQLKLGEEYPFGLVTADGYRITTQAENGDFIGVRIDGSRGFISDTAVFDPLELHRNGLYYADAEQAQKGTRAKVTLKTLVALRDAWLENNDPDLRSPSEVKRFFDRQRALGKKVVTYAGYSGAGYEHRDEVRAKIKKELLEILQDNPKLIVNAGATPDGIGEIVYGVAAELKQEGYAVETAGVVSKNALEYHRHFPQVDYTHVIDDEKWGGSVLGDVTLTPTSQAMVEASDILILHGGGDVSGQECVGALYRGIPCLFRSAEMNHASAAKKGIRNLRGTAELIVRGEIDVLAAQIHEAWRVSPGKKNAALHFRGLPDPQQMGKEMFEEWQKLARNRVPKPAPIQVGDAFVDLTTIAYDDLPSPLKNRNTERAQILINTFVDANTAKKVPDYGAVMELLMDRTADENILPEGTVTKEEMSTVLEKVKPKFAKVKKEWIDISKLDLFDRRVPQKVVDENRATAVVIVEALESGERNTDNIAKLVHEDWMARNPQRAANSNFRPYEELDARDREKVRLLVSEARDSLLQVQGSQAGKSGKSKLSELLARRVQLATAGLRKVRARRQVRKLSAAQKPVNLSVREHSLAREIFKSWQNNLEESTDGQRRAVTLVESGKRYPMHELDFEELPASEKVKNYRAARIVTTLADAGFSIDEIAAEMHRDWIRLNPDKKVEANFFKLDQAAKEKTRSLVRAALNHRDKIDKKFSVVQKASSAMHEDWRAPLRILGTNFFEPQYEHIEGVDVDKANTEFSRLPIPIQERNIRPATALIELIDERFAKGEEIDRNFIELLADRAHTSYEEMKGIPKEKRVPFAKLSKAYKTINYRIANRIIQTHFKVYGKPVPRLVQNYLRKQGLLHQNRTIPIVSTCVNFYERWSGRRIR